MFKIQCTLNKEEVLNEAIAKKDVEKYLSEFKFSFSEGVYVIKVVNDRAKDFITEMPSSLTITEIRTKYGIIYSSEERFNIAETESDFDEEVYALAMKRADPTYETDSNACSIM